MEQLIESKLIKADKAFSVWRKVPFEERQKLIAKAAEILKNNSEKFGKIITTEMNKPISESIAEVEKCALMMNYYAAAENICRRCASLKLVACDRIESKRITSHRAIHDDRAIKTNLRYAVL
jgi:acyl-CoA reductase-like NAD-dependent aldehyde dehydrogenase